MSDKKIVINEEVTRQSVDVFCSVNNLKKVDLAKALGVERQYLNHWRTSKLGYFIEHNTETGKLKVIQSEKVIKECKIKLAKAVA